MPAVYHCHVFAGPAFSWYEILIYEHIPHASCDGLRLRRTRPSGRRMPRRSTDASFRNSADTNAGDDSSFAQRTPDHTSGNDASGDVHSVGHRIARHRRDVDDVHESCRNLLVPVSDQRTVRADLGGLASFEPHERLLRERRSWFGA